MTTEQIDDTAPILRAILDVPSGYRRLDAVAAALRVVIDKGWLETDCRREKPKS